ncbi:MAG: hypothetical protein AAF696_25680 [Bacteroidota bacterium]
MLITHDLDQFGNSSLLGAEVFVEVKVKLFVEVLDAELGVFHDLSIIRHPREFVFGRFS